MKEHPSAVGTSLRTRCGTQQNDTSIASSAPMSAIITSWITALFFLSTAHATDFRASVWMRVEDDVAFRYIVLRDCETRLLLPRIEGYSIDSTPEQLRLYHGQVEIRISALDEACTSAVRKNDAAYLRAASKPSSETSGNTRLVSESTGEFAERGWPSLSFQYTCTGYGLATNVWVAYLLTPSRAFYVRVSADPASFARAKTDAIETIKRMRHIDQPTFDRQFAHDE